MYHVVCVKWRYYLTLNKTVVHSDHHNLAWLFNHAHKDMIERWYAHLAAYDLDLTYVTGKSQVVADPLSRILKASVRAVESPLDPRMYVSARILSRSAALRNSETWSEEACVTLA